MTASAPIAPGRLGTPLGVAEAVAYLEALGRWIDERRRELDTLDEAILASPQSQSLTKDMVLSLSLWQAVKARHDVLLVTWDSGRVGARELERLAALIWGRLDDTVPGPDATAPGGGALGGLAVSLPEACRLSDALAGQLRSRPGSRPPASAAGPAGAPARSGGAGAIHPAAGTPRGRRRSGRPHQRARREGGTWW